MRVSIQDLAGKRILAGAQEGRALLLQLVEAIREPETPQALFLDFRGVDVATTSFLREGPLAYRRLVRAQSSKIYPIFANANEHIVDELKLFLISQKDAVFTCTLTGGEKASKLRLVGRLDEKQALTLEFVKQLGEVDAARLVSTRTEPGTRPNAWNNRLAALAQKGLIVESLDGRTKKFRLPVEA